MVQESVKTLYDAKKEEAEVWWRQKKYQNITNTH
jgi:hypothetical protein